jgi:hypothetical protein
VSGYVYQENYRSRILLTWYHADYRINFDLASLVSRKDQNSRITGLRNAHWRPNSALFQQDSAILRQSCILSESLNGRAGSFSSPVRQSVFRHLC